MPCDGVNASAFIDVLDEVKMLISMHSECDYVVLGGDFNTDFTRTNSQRVISLGLFMHECNLKNCSLNAPHVDFTYVNDATGARSVIDHFLISENLIPNVVHFSSLHDGDNLSDHCPIKLQLSLPMMRLHNDPSPQPSESRKKEVLAEATEDNIRNYKSTLRQLLSLIPVPYAALQDDRDSQAHRQAVHENHDIIVNACIRAAEATIPHTKRRGRAGWKRHAEPQKKNAILWNRIWKESGSPNTGIIHNIRKKTRAEYRRASQWVNFYRIF
ncbi:hypothetical protein CAPTEDRAFT_192739 [Capitella teleta]|uniref:Endonuclease/exonuclease/phosphatase domain-containing protein n=1 Tax=Capitella teleta TaxID=283909 RepID=R7T584_CAPTE|nr:hypothetical protein CAPTEDRAFT_192739 [Capitella teleta]|eukprot:ELT88223.1 hypothetical protein CAPTEDRAFT_192739 [Capitella teleta]